MEMFKECLDFASQTSKTKLDAKIAINHSVKHSSKDFNQKKLLIMKNDITFSNSILDFAYPKLKFSLNTMKLLKDEKITIDLIKKAKKNIKKSLFEQKSEENHEKSSNKIRNFLGITEEDQWVQNFNIGSVMHMYPIFVNDFSFYGELFYEISKKNLTEKVLKFICIFFFI